MQRKSNLTAKYSKKTNKAVNETKIVNASKNETGGFATENVFFKTITGLHSRTTLLIVVVYNSEKKRLIWALQNLRKLKQTTSE